MTIPVPTPAELRDAGLLRDIDVHFARAATRLAGEADPLVALGAAVASRAPGAGHVCAELREIGRLVRLEGEEADGRGTRWPDAEPWIAALRGSALVAAPGGDGARPLVLDGDRLYLARYWCHQQRLLAALRERAAEERDDVDEAVLAAGLERLFPRADGHAGDPDRQRIAACVAVLRSLAIVTGGPGTGKTTTVVKILALLLEQAARRGADAPPLRIALAAPTGKAAARMVEAIRRGAGSLRAAPAVLDAIPDTAFTLHRLLGVDPDRPTRTRHHADDPLAVDVLVVDEASMVDLALFVRLLDAVPAGARLILLGDRDQLTSVEAGAILGDVCGSGEHGFSREFGERVRRIAAEALPAATPGKGAGVWECVVRLTRSHRFRPDGGIGALAAAVNEGQEEGVLALLRGAAEAEDGELAWRPVPAGAADASAVRQLAVDGYRDYLRDGDPSAVLHALERFRVLCAHRGGAFGVVELNARIAAWLREERLLPPPAGPADAWWHGRPIIVTENDYQLGLFNGDTGVILVHEGRARAWFRTADGAGVRSVAPLRLPAHESVFAMTVHKSQGSEFDRVALVLPQRPSPILTRELLYTGITRARAHVTIVGGEEVLRRGVAEQVQRASGIQDALWGGSALVDADVIRPGY